MEKSRLQLRYDNFAEITFFSPWTTSYEDSFELRTRLQEEIDKSGFASERDITTN
jgi:hypothetical protein